MPDNNSRNLLSKINQTVHDRTFWQETLKYTAISFGGFVINLSVYALLTEALGLNVTVSSVAAWLVVLFVLYGLHSKFVFKLHHDNLTDLVKRFLGFTATRVTSEILEVLLLNITVEMAGWSNLPSKILVSFIAALFNYALSKLIIFRKKEVDASQSVAMEFNHADGDAA